MKIRNRNSIKLSKQNTGQDGACVLNPGKSVSIPFLIRQCGYPVRRRLRIVGEVEIYWRWREESGMPRQVYRSIEDALDYDHACGETCSLHFPGRMENWPRNTWIKIPANRLPSGKRVTFSVLAKASRLKIAEGKGAVVVEIGLYMQKPGRDPDDAFDPPDRIECLRIPAGTYDWTEFKKSFLLPPDAVLGLVRIGGLYFSGDAWIGTPRLEGGERGSEIPSLAPPNPFRPEYNWLGENLSRKEWPEFKISVDGRECFAGAVFNAIFRRPDFEVALPDLAPGKHRLTVRLAGNYHTAPAFTVQAIEILEESSRDFEILSYPEFATESSKFRVLVETNHKGSVVLSIREPNAFRKTVRLARPGLHVVALDAGTAGVNKVFSVSDGRREERLTLLQVVRRLDDRIRLSSGDAVYIPQTPETFLRYIEWYTENRIGNAVCFRPVYRWCGSRELEPAAWRAVVPLMEKLGMDYSLMVDGRELPGRKANPPDELLAGPRYMGRQSHEQDGSFCYWGKYMDDGLFMDIFSRSGDKNGIIPAIRPVRRPYGTFQFFDPRGAADMRAATRILIGNLKKAKDKSTRHTGPSVLFRYFYQAGYDWLGAEQMYGPEEVILAALRGASRAYGRKSFGAHLAVQWSSIPHDTPEHAARFFLSLATCYLQGVEHINTEEGFWRMESNYAPYDRFSSACARHRAANAKFRRFMESHERRGVMRVPLGIIQGRYDGWRCFGRGHAWQQDGKEWEFGPPEESFDLLKVFYPRSVLNAIYKYPCPKTPQGWYSGTPFGPVDLIPIEARLDVLRRYQALAFLGWNTYTDDDFKRLLKYVMDGGVLILARPHLSGHVRRGLPSAVKLSPTLRALLGTDFENAHSVIRRKVGKGKLVYFPADMYPVDQRIRSAYERELAKLGTEAAETECERGWIRGSKDVNFAVYDWKDGVTRTIYLLNIDWWNGRKVSFVEFLFGEKEFKVPVRAGEIKAITVAHGLAVMPESSDVDVMSLRESNGNVQIDIQSTEPGTVRIYEKNDGRTPLCVKLARSGVQSVSLAPGRMRRRLDSGQRPLTKRRGTYHA